MNKIYIGFYWHHHQPYYLDRVSGETPLPWVRLHAIKGYYGMAAHLENHPDIKATFNLVPSLIEQIFNITEKGCKDYYQVLTEKAPSSLLEHEVDFILANFFSANWETMVKPYPRYHELLSKRGPGRRSYRSRMTGFTETDIRDLQVWFNLAWFHPSLLQNDKTLAGLVEKDRHFSEDDKQKVIAKQLETVGQIIPLYSKLAERGQVELTTSPYYHPILPLLYDMESTHEAMPGAKLPVNHKSLADDAAVHLDRAMELHENVFGARPTGMWPPEGSVSQDIIKPISERGIKWIATDEAQLSASLGKVFKRNRSGDLIDPSVLFQPYLAGEEGSDTAIIFRDSKLSNAISFEYQRQNPEEAVKGLLGYLKTAMENSGGKPLMVAVILDGENPWEYYPGGGVEFLEHLYGRLSETSWVETTTITEFIENHPPENRLPKICAGSWINGNFYTWIGHREDVAGWEALFSARSEIEKSKLDEKTLQEAREEIYIAEGSDWYWWFGDDHSSAHDDVFDKLFRDHLYNVYTILGKEAPESLTVPIMTVEDSVVFEEPTGLLNVKIDGRVSSFFEWLGAGTFDNRRAQGAMESAVYHIKGMLFGFDHNNFYLRTELTSEGFNALENGAKIAFSLKEPVLLRFLTQNNNGKWKLDLYKNSSDKPEKSIDTIAIAKIMEICCPLDMLEVKPGNTMVFSVEVLKNGRIIERVPLGAPIRLPVPGKDFEERMWV